MSKIHIIHENGVWVEPLRQQLDALSVAYEEWNLVEGSVPIDEVPPEGIFYNRMSASSYTRDHRFAPEYAAVVLSWLEAHGRRIVNDSRALALEINKAAQHQLLNHAGIKTPATVVAVGNEAILKAAAAYKGRKFIVKPNRGGKGDGVQLFEDIEALRTHLDSPSYIPPVDGISLVQEYIVSPENCIVRAEFIGGEIFYTVRVDTSDGFELCPADVCQIPDEEAVPKFRILEPDEYVERDVLTKLQFTLRASGVEVAGVEFIRDADGQLYAYDINTNTNYNPDAEAVAGVSGMKQLAKFLTSELYAYNSEKIQLSQAAA